MDLIAHKTDFHMHSTVSDGTDTPEDIISVISNAKLTAFSLTDHDAVKGCRRIISRLTASDPKFMTGVEFNCRDQEGKYHILGYGYDPDSEAIGRIVDYGHDFRMRKLMGRLEYLKKEFGFEFSTEEVNELETLDNPGKPHIANLMVAHGYAPNKAEAISNYIDKAHFPPAEYIRPETVIEGIRAAGGIPVLAHPIYGSGDELIMGGELDARIRKLIAFGLMGVEGFYSGFSEVMTKEVLHLAETYNLYVTAGSDYHGTNKLVEIGDTTLTEETPIPAGLSAFLERASDLFVKVG